MTSPSCLTPISYQPLPDDWLVGITDVVDSTSAIASGRYKDVNYAGASAIAALGNAWNSFDFPFVFRGDGAAFAVHPDRLTSATIVLQQTAAYARDSLQLGLRAGLVSVKEIRLGGSDVRTAQFAASDAATYAMFAGDDAESKNRVAALVREIGYDAVDIGGIECARYLEPLVELIIQLAYVQGSGTVITPVILTARDVRPGNH